MDGFAAAYSANICQKDSSLFWGCRNGINRRLAA
jgi:hypothetical protein